MKVRYDYNCVVFLRKLTSLLKQQLILSLDNRNIKNVTMTDLSFRVVINYQVVCSSEPNCQVPQR